MGVTKNALRKRQGRIMRTVQRVRREAPDASDEVLRLFAEADYEGACLFVKITSGDYTGEVLRAYMRNVEHRMELLTRLRLLPQSPRPRVKDHPELDPFVQEHLREIGALNDGD